jgi:hypothetical protein
MGACRNPHHSPGGGLANVLQSVTGPAAPAALSYSTERNARAAPITHHATAPDARARLAKSVIHPFMAATSTSSLSRYLMTPKNFGWH